MLRHVFLNKFTINSDKFLTLSEVVLKETNQLWGDKCRFSSWWDTSHHPITDSFPIAPCFIQYMATSSWRYENVYSFFVWAKWRKALAKKTPDNDHLQKNAAQNRCWRVTNVKCCKFVSRYGGQQCSWPRSLAWPACSCHSGIMGHVLSKERTSGMSKQKLEILKPEAVSAALFCRAQEPPRAPRRGLRVFQNTQW